MLLPEAVFVQIERTSFLERVIGTLFRLLKHFAAAVGKAAHVQFSFLAQFPDQFVFGKLSLPAGSLQFSRQLSRVESVIIQQKGMLIKDFFLVIPRVQHALPEFLLFIDH